MKNKSIIIWTVIVIGKTVYSVENPLDKFPLCKVGFSAKLHIVQIPLYVYMIAWYLGMSSTVHSTVRKY